MSAGPRILIVKLSSLGDLFHALPAVHNLKQELDAPVDWVTQPEYADLVGCFTDVERVIVFPRRQTFIRGIPFVRDLRRERYEYAVDLQGLLKSALVTKWSRAIRRIGPSYCREGAHLFYSDIAGPKSRDRHAVDQALDVIGFLDLEMLEPKFPVVFPKAERNEPRPRVALIPCSRWKTKNWPVERFVETGRALRDRLGAALFILGSRPDAGVCGEIEAGLAPGVVNTCGATSLVGLGSLLQEMDLVISVDSGPMHMAAAIGVPVLAVFGPTDPERTGPFGETHRVIQAQKTPCWPCRNRACPACTAAMAGLSAEVVSRAAMEMLAR